MHIQNQAVSTSILILGTSNSLMSVGWVAGLRSALPDAAISNWSVGGSPGIQFGCVLNTDFSKYDYVVFDSVPNDERPTAPTSFKNFSWSLLHEIFATISSQTRLIVLGFTNLIHLDQESEEYQMRRRLSVSVGANFIDIRSFVCEHAAAILVPGTPLYEHASHPDRDFSRVIGYSLGVALRDHPGSVESLGVLSAPMPSLRVVTPGELCPERVLSHRNSSLVSANFIELRSGESVKLPPYGKLIGFYVDKVRTDGCLLLRFRDREARRSLPNTAELPSFELSFVQLSSGMVLDEMSLIERDGQTPGEAHLSLSTLLFRSTTAPITSDWGQESLANGILHRQVENILVSRLEHWRRNIFSFRNAKNAQALGNLDEQIAFLGSALSAIPDHAEALYDLGRAYAASRQLDQALVSVDSLIRLESRNAFAHELRGQVLAQLGQSSEAVMALRLALEIRPKLTVAAMELRRLEGPLAG